MVSVDENKKMIDIKIDFNSEFNNQRGKEK